MTIQFAQQTTVCPITPILAKERRGIYYSKSDYVAFKRDMILTAQQEQQGCGYVCLDGLENLVSKENAERRRQRIANARFDVLTEQADQRLQGVSSPDFIAELYEDISAPCHQEAHEKALRYYEETMSYKDPSDDEDLGGRSKMMERRQFVTRLMPNFMQHSTAAA